MSHTTQPTGENGHIDVIEQLRAFNPNTILPQKSSNEDKKTKRQDKSDVWICPFENLHNLSNHIIGAATKVSEHRIFKKEKNLFLENLEKKKILNLPENGCHEETPYNMHLTGRGSQGSDIWLPQLQKQEELTNIYRRKTNNFISQFNMNLSSLGTNIAVGEPVSLFGPDVDAIVEDYYPIYDLATGDFNEQINNPLLNMNDVFAVETQDL